MTVPTVSELPLSAAQNGVWLAQQVEPRNRSFHIGHYVDIAGPVDMTALSTAVRQAYAECDALRVRIVLRESTFRQELGAVPELPLTVIDFGSDPDPAGAARQWMLRDLGTEADLSGEHLAASALLILGPQRTIWYQRCHHVLLDGYSAGLLAERAAASYTALVTDTPCPAPSFGTLDALLEEEADYRSSDAFARDKAFWNDRFADRPDVTGLSEAPAVTVESLVGHSGVLPAHALSGLTAAAGLSEQGWPAAVIAAVAAYVHRITGARDVVLGMPVTGRQSPLTLRTPGMLANILPLRLEVTEGVTATELVRTAARESRRLVRHQRYNQEDLKRDLGWTEGRRLYGPEVNILPAPRALRFAGARGTVHHLANGPVEDIAFSAYADYADHGTDTERDGRRAAGDPAPTIRLDIAANPRCHTPEEVAGHAARFPHFLTLLAQSPDAPVSRTEVLTDVERRQLLTEWIATDRTDSFEGVVERIRRMAGATPAAPAVVDDRHRLDYRALAGRASALSRRLTGDGSAPGDLCAVLTDRGAHVVTAMLGIWGAGGAYTHLNPDDPLARIAALTADSGIRRILTDETHRRLAETVADAVDAPVRVMLLGEETDDPDDLFPVVPVGDGLAYVYFTSGSTGRPKGAMVHHHGMVNHLVAKNEDLEMTAESVVMHNAPLTSDVSVWQMLSALLVGGRTRIVDEPTATDPFQLFAVVAQEGITILEVVPSFLRAMLTSRDTDPAAFPARLPNLRWFVVNGEALPPESCARWFALHPDIPIVNAYGPTECSDDVTHAFLSADSPLEGPRVPIGRPLRNTRLYVLDDRLRPVPVGVPGELYVGGVGVGPGYVNDPRRTCAAFLPDPFRPGTGARMYRTGDRVRFLPDGRLDFLGRRDFQVKIRGRRIDLGEVEAALATAPGVREAVAAVIDGPAGQKVLVGYVSGQADPETLRVHAADVLPGYAVPTVFVPLDSLPLNRNGKVDRGALPAVDPATWAGGRAPQTREEKELAVIFADVLGIPSVGADDDFFALGGDSILSIQVVSRARRAGLEMTPRDVFLHKTPSALARVARPAAPPAPGAPADDGTGLVPATPAVHRLREVASSPLAVAGFHQSVLVNVPAALREEDLVTALQAVLDRHDALRARLVPGTVWALDVPPAGLVDARECVRRHDVSEASAQQYETIVRNAFAAARDRLAPLDGRMVQAVWFDAGPERSGTLLLVVHHLVVDGVSWRILLPDLADAWQSAAQGRTPELAPVRTSLRGWAEGLVLAAQDPRLADDLALWTDELDPVSTPGHPFGRRPSDPVTGTVAHTRTHTAVVDDPALVEALTVTVPQAFGADTQDVLLTGLALALAGATEGGDDGGRTGLLGVPIEVEGHGREPLGRHLQDTDLTRTVGWFTSTYPVRVDMPAAQGGAGTGESIVALLKQVKERLRTLSRQRVGYGLLRHLNPVTASRLAALPAPEVSFNYLGQLRTTDEDGPDWLVRSDSRALTAQGPDVPVTHALETVVAHEVRPGAGDRLSFTLTWLADVEEEAGGSAVADRWIRALRTLADHVTGTRARGLTPSDVLLDVTQEEIDQFEGEF